MLGHLCGCVVLHVILDVLDAFVEHAEGLGIHPGVVRRLVVNVRTINHKVSIGVIFVMDDVLLRNNGDDVLDKPVSILDVLQVVVDVVAIPCPRTAQTHPKYVDQEEIGGA